MLRGNSTPDAEIQRSARCGGNLEARNMAVRHILGIPKSLRRVKVAAQELDAHRDELPPTCANTSSGKFTRAGARKEAGMTKFTPLTRAPERAPAGDF